MPHRFGEHEADEVINAANTFVTHVETGAIWASMSDPVRGRMKHADVARGRELLATARTGRTGSAATKGVTAGPTHKLDLAETAAEHWLGDQLTHARGALHEAGDDVTLAALAAALSDSGARGTVAKNIRAYVALARAETDAGRAISASYADTRSRNAILRDGEHLADAVEPLVGAPGSALGEQHDATVTKDDAVGALARWLRRWTDVAHRVVGAADQHTLGIAHRRHHPEHRAQHPAAVTPPAQPPAAT